MCVAQLGVSVSAMVAGDERIELVRYGSLEEMEAQIKNYLVN